MSSLGQEDSRCAKRKSYCQSSEQDQVREVPRSADGEGRKVKGRAQKGTGRKARSCTLSTPQTRRQETNFAIQKKEEARIAQERKEKKWQKDHAYDELFQEGDPDEANNQNRGEDWEDDFMQTGQVFFYHLSQNPNTRSYWPSE